MRRIIVGIALGSLGVLAGCETTGRFDRLGSRSASPDPAAGGRFAREAVPDAVMLGGQARDGFRDSTVP